MALYDFLAQFADGATITATVANAIVGDVYDTNATPILKDIGTTAKPVWLNLIIPTAVTSNGSATVEFTLLSDSTFNLATSATTHWRSGAIPKATLVAGYKMSVQLPPGQYERYVGIFANTAVQTLNTGTLTAYLSLDPPTNFVAYPDAL